MQAVHRSSRVLIWALCKCRHRGNHSWLWAHANPTATHVQESLHSALLSLGLPARRAHDTAGGIPVDVALPTPKIAIELASRTHCTTNTGQLLGASQLKHRLLTALGWRVLHIPCAAWPATLPEQRAYLQSAFGTERLAQLVGEAARAAEAGSANGSPDGEIGEVQRPGGWTQQHALLYANAKAQRLARAEEEVREGDAATQEAAALRRADASSKAAQLDIVAFKRGQITRPELLRREALRRAGLRKKV